MIKLYDYWRSSASYRVRIVLGLADMQWDTQPVNLLEAEQRSEAHLARNPQGLVPVLEVDGHSLTQSLAQIEYLDETRKLGLLPATAIGRAEVRALSYAIAMETHPVCNLNVVRWAVANSDNKITMEGWMRHFITQGLDAYEGMVSGGAYSYGESVSMADVCLRPQIYNAERWGVDLGAYPNIARIHATLDAIPAFQHAHPDETPQG
ncbi:maleylacetoacetate isomerase [uncultured Shimia sp.]|uniref:maleylacetoacetate isomerase n=1 Tax=uncultured Shimia sp. TaxID=573152 RepID=UPI0025E61C9A|nr:maleylacetoacetate isomerase [uncultured Shimia sp.]